MPIETYQQQNELIPVHPLIKLRLDRAMEGSGMTYNDALNILVCELNKRVPVVLKQKIALKLKPDHEV